MKLSEFNEQEKHCKEHNTPEGKGCIGCGGESTHYCADRLVNTCGEFVKAKKDTKEWETYKDELINKFGMTPYSILALYKGEIELEA